MGIFAQETLGKLFEEDAAEVAELQHANGKMYIDGIEGIEVIQAE
jgi:glycine cleavage system protein P-like pyridoxal-binding family